MVYLRASNRSPDAKQTGSLPENQLHLPSMPWPGSRFGGEEAVSDVLGRWRCVVQGPARARQTRVSARAAPRARRHFDLGGQPRAARSDHLPALRLRDHAMPAARKETPGLLNRPSRPRSAFETCT